MLTVSVQLDGSHGAKFKVLALCSTQVNTSGAASLHPLLWGGAWALAIIASLALGL